ncbi:hypothetical protein ANCDUO_00336 [Ancylostoma duodenale]|uniref:Uncharacterized protein n=1 Tax=Ancylostoma duodenale TaxID=51022 RepID=A0A0C2DH85_9BILA|nr:hypothetical protein ANCDUO_00336 [Ancylostoma duodenale]
MTLLSRNDMLSEADVVRLMKVQKQLHSLTLTIISFVQVSLKLSDKSTRRLEHIIIHLTKVEFLDSLFKVDGPHAKVLAEFVNGLENLIDSKDL